MQTVEVTSSQREWHRISMSIRLINIRLFHGVTIGKWREAGSRRFNVHYYSRVTPSAAIICTLYG